MSFGAASSDREFDITLLSADAKRRLNALKKLELQGNVIHRQFLAELTELEKKYHVQYQPIYEKRAAIVTGEHEPTDAETEVPETVQDFTALEAEEGEAVEEGPVTGVPKFWMRSLLNHPQIAELITEADEAALASLKDIKLHYLDDNPGFSLEFVFGENDFFANESLTKTYFLSEPEADTDSDEEYVFERTEATPINWKDGKDLTVKVEVRKQRHKDTNKTRVVKRTVPADSFFNFFKSQKVPGPEDEGEEEELDELEAMLEMDYQMGEEIKDKIIPQALKWFTGEAAMDYEGYGDEFDGEGFDSDDFGSDEDDE
ncbi:histone chaperone [Blastocladiella emersonii ATCC 22665]|nr:histone chaperone [Blastocladiella emersonii ATCC 22665]